MANKKPSFSLKDNSPEKRKEIAKMGGIASGKSRKLKKNMREAALSALNREVTPEQAKAVAKRYDIEEDEVSARFVYISRLEELAAGGDLQAMRFLLELAGESPNQIAMKEMEKSKQAQVEDDPFSASLKSLFGGGGE